MDSVDFWKKERERDELCSLLSRRLPTLCLTSSPLFSLSPPSILNSQGSSIFAGGIFLVLMGWAATGMAVETYGFWLLFAGFFPTVLGFLRRAPVLGPLLDTPGVKRALNRVAPAQSLPM